MATNLLATIDKWRIEEGFEDSGVSEVADSLIVSEDGYGASFTITNEGSYIYCRLNAESYRGSVLKLKIDNFTSTDNLPVLQIYYFTDMDEWIYTEEWIEMSQVAFPYEKSITVPMDCVNLQFMFRHDWDDDGIDPAATITISGVSLMNTSTESATAINFHKVLKENLPTSVTAGTHHIYFAYDTATSTVEQYVSKNDGTLVKVVC